MARNQSYEITVAGVSIRVTKKKVKHLRMVAYPSRGAVRISSPLHIPDSEVKEFAESRREWIDKHLNDPSIEKKKLPDPYISGSTHYLWGNPFTLYLNHDSNRFGVHKRKNGDVELLVKPGSDQDICERVMREWYRLKLKKSVPPLIKKWENIMKVNVKEWNVKKMKTRWGTCNTRARRIWLSLDLAKRDPEFLEYIVVHEMTHLLERPHSWRFYRLMDQFMPGWRAIDKRLGGKHWNKRG